MCPYFNPDLRSLGVEEAVSSQTSGEKENTGKYTPHPPTPTPPASVKPASRKDTVGIGVEKS